MRSPLQGTEELSLAAGFKSHFATVTLGRVQGSAAFFVSLANGTSPAWRPGRGCSVLCCSILPGTLALLLL